MRRALTFALSLSLLTACSDFERIDFDVSAPPVDIVVTYDQIRIPEGVAVVAIARPIAGDSIMSTDTTVKLSAANPGILGVGFALPQQVDPETPDAQWSYVLMGILAGSTTLEVRVDDDLKKEIPAVIEMQ